MSALPRILSCHISGRSPLGTLRDRVKHGVHGITPQPCLEKVKGFFRPSLACDEPWPYGACPTIIRARFQVQYSSRTLGDLAIEPLDQVWIFYRSGERYLLSDKNNGAKSRMDKPGLAEIGFRARA